MKRKAILIPVLLIISAYFLGIATGKYRLFPYNYLFQVKEELGLTESKRNLESSNLEQVNVEVTGDTGIYMTYGQSNSVNHGQIGYEVKREVFQFLDNNTYVYQDPSLGGTGDDGSVWGMLGDKLIAKGVHDKVIFSNNGWQGKSLEELNKPPYLDYLIKNYNALINKFGRVDAILFHQGEINHSEKLGNENYLRDFKVLIEKLENEGVQIPIYLSRTSICDTKSDSGLINIQNQIIEEFDLVFKGPNTDLLYEKKYRLPDNCHFSMLGYEKFSDMWVNFLTEDR